MGTLIMGVSLNLIKMFGDLKSSAGVKALDEFLAEHSYIEGFVPSQADTAVFEALAGAPKSDTPHALRWYNHIKSFAAGMKQFPKAEKDASAYVLELLLLLLLQLMMMTMLISLEVTRRKMTRKRRESLRRDLKLMLRRKLRNLP